MAELYAGALGYEPAPNRSFGTIANWIGAVLSVLLIIGVAVWGYRLMVRDVSGVPVVRASQGPMREQPKTPGGRPADYQGLAVNAVAAEGAAEAPADRLVLAPAPQGLTDEDGATAVLWSDSDTVAQSGVEAGNEVAKDNDPTINALVAELTKDAQPLSATEPSVQSAADAKVTSKPQTGVLLSMRPRLRPARLSTSAVSRSAAIGAAVAAAQFRDVDPASIPTGTRLAQLGAYDNASVAEREWERLTGKFGDYMAGKDRVIQKAEAGGRTFYRLRAMGFEDLSDARRFCAAFVSAKADCIPVVTR